LGGWFELGQTLPEGGGGLEGGGAAGGGAAGGAGVVGGAGVDGAAGAVVLGISWYSFHAPYAMRPAPIAFPSTAIM
jgi:hypothetical protein